MRVVEIPISAPSPSSPPSAKRVDALTSTVDDPHYSYKLEWLAALRETASGWLTDDPQAQIALVGDWNIAPSYVMGVLT